MSNQPRAPGRPRQFDAAAVIDRAVNLFWRRGYRATTTRDMQDELGLAQSSIYNTFGSKRRLLELALDRYEAKTTDALLKPLLDADDGLSALDAFFADLGAWISRDGRHGCLLTNLMAEDGGKTASITDRGRAYCEHVREAFADALQRAIDAGQVDAELDVAKQSKLLLGLVLGMNVTARATESRELPPVVDAIRAEIASWRTVAV